MARPVLVLNGPNLNMLGTREPEIYGHETLADLDARCRALGAALGLAVECRQSNAEHQLIDWIQEARGTVLGIVINPAGYTHSSVAIRDALTAFDGPVIEVHLSNIHRREPFRHHSYISGVAEAVIAGMGPAGYEAALRRIAELTG
ncbi:MAG: type II 3-dehydroquinate dehydratase [Pseudomonadota bacterium]